MNTKDSRGYNVIAENIVRMLREREFHNNASRLFQNNVHMTEAMINRLGLDSTLHGHKGCVNCLDWSDNGRLLISGSDDTKVILWDAFKKSQLEVVSTRHVGNIFSVKFLPGTNSSQVVTGAGDTFVTVINITRNNTDGCPEPPLFHCRCHGGRVKRIATAPDLHDVFWSAGEDGLVLQFDLREPHHCSGTVDHEEGNTSGAVLVDLSRHAGWHAEAKCVAVNPIRPHLLAVGTNDAYARLYDRRFMKTSPYQYNHSVHFRDMQACIARTNVLDESIPQSSAQYYVPGHLGTIPGYSDGDYTPERHYKLAATYVTFSPDGNELLVNLGGEHIYLYDINNMTNYINKLIKPTEGEKMHHSNGYFQKECCCSVLNLPYIIDDLAFNDVLGDSHDIPTTNPHCACEYARRADILMKRKWLGDFYAAARDYVTALGMVMRRRPLIGVIYALIRLKWWAAADRWLKLLREHYGPKSEWEIKHLEYFLQKGKNDSRDQQTDEDLMAIKTSGQEDDWRKLACDYKTRFIGHCNTTTDIKEAVFLGSTGGYVAAGSDDGVMYIWRKEDSCLVSALAADTSIVNCIQPHPSTCLVATSGIEPVVKLWTPRPDDGTINELSVTDFWQIAKANQQRIAMDPFETMLANMGYQVDMISPRTMPVCRTS